MADISNKLLRIEILNKYNYKCAYCGTNININTLSVDHREPLRRNIKESKVHLNTPDNFYPCCKSCNSSKASMSLEKWRAEINKKNERLIRDNSSYRLMVRFGIIHLNTDWKFYFETLQ